MHTTGRERRLHRRVPLGVRCWCDGQGVTLYVSIVNANPGGLFVRTYTPFPPGDRISVRWKFPGGEQEHHVAAVVVWRRDDDFPPGGSNAQRPPGMGLKFLDLPELTRSELEKLEEAR